MSFGVNNFWNTWELWGSFVFQKCLKSNVDSKNALRKTEKVFGFSDNCIWIGSGKLSLWLQQYS